jgi:isovaleryl-CoA dehydrogenase
MLISKLIRKFSFTNFHRVANLPTELEEFREHVAGFCKTEILPLANQVDKKDCFPLEIMPKLGEFGLLGLTCPDTYGGLNMGYTAQSLAMEEISRASGSIGLSYGAHTNLCINQIVRYGNEEQKQKYLPGLCSGHLIGALAMSETGAGSDVTSMTTSARRDGDFFVLNGSKMWITNGPIADVIIVYAKTDNGISTFLVDKTTEGFSVMRKLDKLGMRGSPTGELLFEDCRIPATNLLGELNKGVYILMSGLDYERLVLSAGPVGLMQAAFDTTLAYVAERKQFGHPIGDFQIMQAKLAQMYTKLQSTRAFLYSLAQQADRGVINNCECASLIYMASENCVEVALEAIQALGGNGYMNEYPTGRYLRDAKLYTIGAGTNEIRLWLIGRALMKEAKN